MDLDNAPNNFNLAVYKQSKKVKLHTQLFTMVVPKNEAKLCTHLLATLHTHFVATDYFVTVKMVPLKLYQVMCLY